MVGSFKELHKRVGFHQLLVFPAAGEKEQGDAADVLGYGIDAGVDPDMLPVGLQKPSLGQQQAGGQEEKAVFFRKVWLFLNPEQPL